MGVYHASFCIQRYRSFVHVLFIYSLRARQYAIIILELLQIEFVDEKVGRSFSRTTVNCFTAFYRVPLSLSAPTQLYGLFIEYCYICNM